MNYRESKFSAYSTASSFQQQQQQNHSSTASSSIISNHSNASILTGNGDVTTTTTTAVCYRCKYPIYPLELMGSIMGKKYHKVCFKCSTCDRLLDLKTFQTNQIDINDTEIYCMSHAPRNGKASIGYSRSQSNSPALQHKPTFNKSNSRELLDSSPSPSPLVASNRPNSQASQNITHHIKINGTEHNNKNENESYTSTRIINIPVIIDSSSTRNETTKKRELNEMGSKLLELSKSNVDLSYDENSENHSRDNGQQQQQTIVIRVENDLDSNNNNNNSPTNSNKPYSPNTMTELYLYDHEIDQLIKDLEENKQPRQFMNLSLLNKANIAGVLVDSVASPTVDTNNNNNNDSKVTILDSNAGSKTSYYNSSMHATESLHSSSTRIQSSALSQASLSETKYQQQNHQSNSISNNSSNTAVQQYIDHHQSASSASSTTTQNSNKHVEFNLNNNTVRQLSKQSSIDSSHFETDQAKNNYVSILMPDSNVANKTNEMLIIKSDSFDHNNKLNYVDTIISGVGKTPENEFNPVLNHSNSVSSNHNNNNNNNNNNNILRPLAIHDPENTILGDNCGLGAIKITIFYDDLRSRLSVTIHQAQNLKNLDKSKKQVSDPYCRVYLLPDDKNKTLKRKTRVVKNNLNPKWEETFDHTMSFETAETKDLIINLKDERGIFQKAEDCFMGEVLLRLKSLSIRNQYTRWIHLQHMNAVSKLLLSSGIRPYS